MVNETLFEIIFSNETKLDSITVIESPTEVLSNFIDIAKNYVASVCKGTVIVCETQVSQEKIKHDHTQYPIDTFILTPDSTKESEILVYHKIKMINPGWVYNSESTKVILFGRIGVRTIKLGQEFVNKWNNLIEREITMEKILHETNLKALATVQRTIELKEKEELLTQREDALNIQTDEIYAAEKELMNFRDEIRQEKNELFKWEIDLLNWERYLETNEQIKNLNTSAVFADESDEDSIEFITAKRQKITKPVVNQVPYLDELKTFFATNLRWKMREEDDTNYVDAIEKNIHRTDNGPKFKRG
jgi:hypothetical protein